MFLLAINPLTRNFLIAALVFLAFSIFLFFFLRIPTVFGELTGFTERKQIRSFAQQNSRTGGLSRRLKAPGQPNMTSKISTGEISTPVQSTYTNYRPNETSVLHAEGFALSNENVTTLLTQEDLPSTHPFSAVQNYEQSKYSNNQQMFEVVHSIEFSASSEYID